MASLLVRDLDLGVRIPDKKRALAVLVRDVDVGDVPDLGGLRHRNASVTGVFFGAELVMGHDRVRALVADLLQRAADGVLQVVIDSEFSLADAEAAHRHIESRKAFGRVLLKPWRSG